MSEPQFFRHPPSAATPLPPSHLNQSGIEIQWQEGTGIVIKIQLRRLTVQLGNHPLQLDGGLPHLMPSVSANGTKKRCPPRPGRWAA
jgi:hypothetical protein